MMQNSSEPNTPTPETKNKVESKAADKNKDKIITPSKHHIQREKKKIRKHERRKLGPGESINSEQNRWLIISLLGSGGFGDVYKVTREGDAMEYALKTESVIGEKHLLRLKVESNVLMMCQKAKPEKRTHFVEFLDRGRNKEFKFIVMGLVGMSLEDIRRKVICKNYSRSTAYVISLQTIEAVEHLHSLGYLHRDIKPANFAVGLEKYNTESTVFMLDFGIARKYRDDKGAIKVPRAYVKFLGTIRYCSRACHKKEEQCQKDDLECWLYMVFDIFNSEHGLSWRRMNETERIMAAKQHFFSPSAKIPDKVPKEFKNIVTFVANLKYGSEPDYQYIVQFLKSLNCKQMDSSKKLDWVGKHKVAARMTVTVDDSTDVSSAADNVESDSGSGGNSQISKQRSRSTQSSIKRSNIEGLKKPPSKPGSKMGVLSKLGFFQKDKHKKE